MQGASEQIEPEDRVPRLAPGWESKGAPLSPAEGFLLSRIDGSTSWHVLRQIAGVDPEEVDRCLERWVDQGLVLIESGCAPTRAPLGAEAAGIDPSLALPVEVQEKIQAFEPRLEASYHEILGVARDADERDIKRAYFELSKLFHPDRYFGREIGGFEARLDRIFKKVALAYELLMDPTTRAEVERSLAAMPPPDAAPEPGEAQTPASPPRPPTRLEMLQRLRRQFRIPDEILAERRFKARQFNDTARVAVHQRKWNEAASCIRLAIAFDPWNDDYKEEFAGIQAEVNQIRAAQLLEEASGAWDARSRSEALRLYEEAMGYRPTDAEIHARAAEVACELEDYERGFEYAERACELAPEVTEHQLLLARSLRGRGLRQKAKKVLEKARELDPSNADVLEELKRLRTRPGRSRGGKP